MLAFLSFVSWTLGCGGPPAPPEAPDPTYVDPKVEMAEKKKIKMPGKLRLDPIDWKKAFVRQRIDDALVPPSVAEARTKSEVPILLPNEPALLENLQIYSGTGWYSATLTGEDRQVMIRGTRAARSYDWNDADKKHFGASEDVTVTMTEGIVTASFSLYGAAYNLEIECNQGEAGEACRDEATARRYVEKLGLAGSK